MVSQYALSRLSLADVDSLLPIEEHLHPHPWTRGNFTDSFTSGYDAFCLRDTDANIIAYCVVMEVVDELHLLNITVASAYQGRGLARQMLDHIFSHAVQAGMGSVLLEVRVSNLRAIHVYQQAGFVEIGRRKAYYPAQQNTREDAIVMRRSQT
ncbi:ribosomal protein S18-alanine N-acetyltransferase [Undibacterium sp. CY7W]|uniref:[Ribosomal protein bS18]-alanine N-acetyltransferase n=1 Tax=Undibacterium rugosum TaxID=2762291 RepID=A0A923IBZ6_9BURK|nr:ribosomal protein S18-alanine N-acetyltransferase [Undibacterium rugosum]MBC3936540.1 ribosomal protein S18-alanine N-acetyltransferase [Undibacterium rugosum]